MGAIAVATTGGAGLGLAILAGLPTCAFRGALACGGVTAGGSCWCRRCLRRGGGCSTSPLPAPVVGWLGHSIVV